MPKTKARKLRNICFRLLETDYDSLIEQANKAGARTPSAFLRALIRSHHTVQLQPRELKNEFRSSLQQMPNTRPTFIYWLVDIRPEVLKEHPDGLPFYCGKTVYVPRRRLHAHKTSAYTTHLHSKNKAYARFRECDGYVKIVVIDTVPQGEDWAERERYWISRSHEMYPTQMTNVCEGGVGAPGIIRDAQTRLNMSKAQKGRKVSEQGLANMRKAQRARYASNENQSVMNI